MQLNSEFWDNRYKTNETGWNIGEPSSPLKSYIDQLENREVSILIPGCGNAYEAEYLHKQGFKNVTVIDYAETAVKQFKNRVTTFPEQNVICDNFFNLKGQFDLVLEQTFFCALNPELRDNYVNQMHALLKPNGKLVGVMFNEPFQNEQPPFGGSVSEYIKRFSPFFDLAILEPCYNSIESRKDREVFMKFIKKTN